MDDEYPYISILNFDNKDYLAVGDILTDVVKAVNFNMFINVSPEGLQFSDKYIYNFSIKNNDVILFDCVEFVFDSILKKKLTYVFGNKKSLYIFIFCFLRRWYKYSFQKALDMTEVFYTVKHNTKLKFNNFEMAQLERYKPPLSILICGDRNASRSFDSILEKELLSLPKKSIVYYDNCKKGVYKKINEMCNKLKIEYETVDIKNIELYLENIEQILIFHEDYQHDSYSKNIVDYAKLRASTSIYLFDLKTKEKII